MSDLFDECRRAFPGEDWREDPDGHVYAYYAGGRMEVTVQHGKHIKYAAQMTHGAMNGPRRTAFTPYVAAIEAEDAFVDEALYAHRTAQRLIAMRSRPRP